MAMPNFTTVAVSDLGTKLYKESATAGKYEQLVPVTAAPATGGAGATIDVTELDSSVKQYISDREETPAYEFDFNATKEKFAVVKAMCTGTKQKFMLEYGDGDGMLFEGIATCWIDSLSAGNAKKGKLSVAVESKTYVADTATYKNA